MRRLWVCLALLLCSCAGKGDPVVVWADPALRSALEALAPQFVQLHKSGWTIEYKESGALHDDLAAGGQPQVVLCAAEQLDELRTSGLVDEGTSRTFGGSLLALVSTKDEKRIVPQVGDLPLVQFKGLGIGLPSTSVGYYAQQALVSDGAANKLGDLVHGFEDTDKLLAALRSGEVDLAFVYAATASQNPDLHVSCVVPEDLHEDVRFLAMATTGHNGDPGVEALLKLLSEDPKVQQTLGAYGYLDRAMAMVEDR
jgi:molybdenum ABC transporter molybdate-binding protein